ncbi:glycosyltransferase family 2 protein [Trichoderma virens Gv29-8]|uniref:Chitin synthase n=1 Tax=Hypocrea virens (strain Gv29-8 / FGSC 10586) TaxID=413071 RepID=G9MT18_HYPVG|nr:glycosyltransferase family 2 protein [Trichoderma virens Gv29-8]EHK23187.1 glycosyltransferase family 2 protein [Trichoderma virens Gv29-8]
MLEQHEISPGQFNHRTGARFGSQLAKVPFFLNKGNFVIDCAIPPSLRSSVESDDDEFTHTRYTAITCGPDEFIDEGFTLRQALFASPRRIKIMINVYMYNEDDIIFAKTMMSVFNNIQYLCKQWGPQSWKNVVVCILSAGRYNIDPQTKALLSCMGIYQEGIARRQVNGRNVVAHLYEHTTQVGLHISGNRVHITPKQSKFPIQILFCLQESNMTMIRSEKWVYRGFARVLDPVMCVPIQSDTKLGSTAIHQLWKVLAAEPMCAAAFGRVKPDTSYWDMFSIIPSACKFEQHLQNCLTLPFEASFGFVSMSPVKLCAFRYEALQDDETGKSPLDSYFEASEPPDTIFGGTLSAARKKLASLRLVFFALITKPNSRWLIRYAPSAMAREYGTDSVGELLFMRRRPVNAYFLDTFHTITHCHEIFGSSHSIVRKVAFMIQLALKSAELLFAWFALGNAFIYFKVLTTSIGSPGYWETGGYVTGLVLEWLYDVSLIAAFVSSINRAFKMHLQIPKILLLIWLVITAYTFICYCLILNKTIWMEQSDSSSASQIFGDPATSLGIAILITYVLWATASLLVSDFWPVITSSIHYIILIPFYINVSDVFAFCYTFNLRNVVADGEPVIELPKVETQNGKGRMDALSDEGLEAHYEQQLNIMRQRTLLFTGKMPSPLQKAERPQNASRMFEALLVIAWSTTNSMLVFLVLGIVDVRNLHSEELPKVLKSRGMHYIAGVMWVLAGLTGVKVIGCVFNRVMTVLRGYMRRHTDEWDIYES